MPGASISTCRLCHSSRTSKLLGTLSILHWTANIGVRSALCLHPPLPQYNPGIAQGGTYLRNFSWIHPQLWGLDTVNLNTFVNGCGVPCYPPGPQFIAFPFLLFIDHRQERSSCHVVADWADRWRLERIMGDVGLGAYNRQIKHCAWLTPKLPWGM